VRRHLSPIFLFCLLAVEACGSTSKSTGKSPAPTGACAAGGCASGGSSGAPGSLGGASFDGGNSLVFNGTGGTPSSLDAGTCESVSHRGESVEADLFIMMDQSGSMKDDVTGGVKWDLLTTAVTAFVNDPASSGIGVGIGYFPVPPSDTDYSCDASDYAKPDVAIATLPGNATALASSMTSHAPGGHTPSVPAITGAIEYAKAWAIAHPANRTVVVFATDGDPNGCSSTVDDAAAAAAAGLADTPSVATYVIGVGKSISKLDEIAMSGGTTKAFIVDTTADTEKQFLDAMNQIRASTVVPCQYAIPSADAGTVDFGKVNVVVTPTGGAPSQILQVDGSDHCDATSGGWYYDDPSHPSRIETCDATCTAIQSDPGVHVDVELGCQTKKAIIN
jgi:hypothetical protein